MIKICFYNQKEKVGKSTLSLAIATYLSDAYPQKICIVDTVQTSDSISMMRKEELERFCVEDTSNPYILKVNSYPEYKNANLDEYDITIFDLDSCNPELSTDFILNSNYIFLVSDTESEEDFKIDKAFYKLLHKLTYEKDFDVKKVFLLFNKVGDTFNLVEYSKNIENIVEYPIEKENILQDISTFSPVNHISVNNVAQEIFNIIQEEPILEVTDEIY